MHEYDSSYPDDLEPIARRLERERPEATPLELDHIKRRVLVRASRSPDRPKGNFMRSRIAILAALTLGFAFSATGAGLAVSGLTDGRADLAQYEEDQPGTVLPEQPPTQGERPTGGEKPSNEETPEGGGQVLPETSQPAPEQVQPARQFQASQSGGSLPFTGFAALPVLLLGIALLTLGVFGRRAAKKD